MALVRKTRSLLIPIKKGFFINEAVHLALGMTLRVTSLLLLFSLTVE